jgi:CHAD domain-containing protein
MLLESTTSVHSGGQDLALFLDERLMRSWRSFKKRMERCREGSTEKRLHQLRVETRRLLAAATVVEVIAPGHHVPELTRCVKQVFRQSSRLRDTHVCACLIKEELRHFPELKPLRKVLQKKEKRLLKKWEEHVRTIKQSRLKKLVRQSRHDVRRVLDDAKSVRRCQGTLMASVDRAHSHTVRLLDRARNGSPARIHRLRIVFKQLRYLIEVLEPFIPGLSRRDFRQMNIWQETMGKIQDTAVLQSFLHKHKQKSGENFWRFETWLARREQRLIIQFLASADRLVSFWPPQSS